MKRNSILTALGSGAILCALAACASTSVPATPAAAAPATTRATTAAAKPAPVVLVKMPNVVGMVLQDAQDLMQKLTHNPVYFTKSHDVRFTRLQLLDNDWKVCTQNVKKGKKFDPATTHIDFGVVKLAESC